MAKKNGVGMEKVVVAEFIRIKGSCDHGVLANHCQFMVGIRFSILIVSTRNPG